MCVPVLQALSFGVPFVYEASGHKAALHRSLQSHCGPQTCCGAGHTPGAPVVASYWSALQSKSPGAALFSPPAAREAFRAWAAVLLAGHGHLVDAVTSLLADAVKGPG